MSAQTPAVAEASDGLAMAMIASSNAPLLLVAADLTVVAASKSFCRTFHIEPATVPGCPLFSLGTGEWDVPQLRLLLKATLAGSAEIDAYALDLVHKDRAVRHVELNVRRLDFADAGAARMIVAISDVTEARDSARRAAEKMREKDERLRENAIVLRDLSHRVANSLQIIASVLLQSAQRVASDETRGHLYDAHSRVMSVAAVQEHLSVRGDGMVHLDTYLNDLCDSLGASMIPDARQVSLNVKVGGGVTTSEVSVALGLILTELVINALKHAFPGHQAGTISVGYHFRADAWTLSVADNGVGRPTDAGEARPGLGTSLIEALARQLSARVVVADNHPGTVVSIIHP